MITHNKKKNLLGQINEFSKITVYKINTQKSAFLHTKNKVSEKETKKTIPLTKSSKKNKVLRNKLNQGSEDEYTENYEMLMIFY